MSATWIRIGAVWGLVGVGLGAFGAHGLEKVATAEGIEWWNTGALYHLLHAPAIVLCGVLGRKGARAAGMAFLLGGILFSGTLYAMALGAPRWFGAVTPLGGLGLMTGWLLLALQAKPSSDGDV